GLMRVRSMQMNDAHIYMTPDQFITEFNAVNEMYLKYFKLFGIEKYLMRFSTHDPSKLGQKFVDEPELWKKTEEMTRNVLKNSGINYVEVPNEAAFYGPKIDVQAWSVIGREFSIATNQVDFSQPRNFDLRYKDRDNIDKIPICIHRAPLGTHERFIGFLIEHYAGNFPLWLSPEQVRILTIGDEPKLIDYARSILKELRAHQVRAEIDDSTDKINGKIQRAEQMKVHTMFVIGKRDIEAENFLTNLECALIKRLCFCVLAGLKINVAEIIKGLGGIEVVRAEFLLLDLQCSQFERLGFGKLALVAIKPAEVPGRRSSEGM